MSFIRIRTIRGRQYQYREERWREGGKVRSRSVCLGPVDGGGKIDWGATLRSPADGHALVDRYLEQDRARQARSDAAHAKALSGLHNQFGLKVGPANPTPIEAPTAHRDAAPEAPPAAEGGQEEASPEGEAKDQ